MTRKEPPLGPPATERTGEGRLPGDLSGRQLIERIIRVDHAGEYGAKRIYEGQLAILARSPAAPSLQHMARQEEEHLAEFERLMVQRRVRPTLLQPLWHVAGYALGAATALLGQRAAMACTIAVEEVIDEHYRGQIDRLGEDEAPLRQTIDRFRRQELEHKEIAVAAGGETATGYDLLTQAIKLGSRTAIWLSERL
ncbi:MAG: demethoxyubiquinone hydroxylase family protein [Proteobacteria bacterium]|nr:demethoxyubiquinone hydroxylase family protein [Pseudomonadota bacterium]MBI3499422.1 demethoxyubiquinone hydroxylase family protein [Pseudomonadota bacterium]